MKKYNKNSQRKSFKGNYKNNFKTKKTRKVRKNTAEHIIEPYQVEVYNNNVDKAFRILEKILKKDRVLETYKESLRFKKPSEIRREKAIRNKARHKKQLEKERQLLEIADK